MAEKKRRPTQRVLLRELALTKDDLSQRGLARLGEELGPDAGEGVVCWVPIKSVEGGKKTVIEEHASGPGRYRAPAADSWDPAFVARAQTRLDVAPS